MTVSAARRYAAAIMTVSRGGRLRRGGSVQGSASLRQLIRIAGPSAVVAGVLIGATTILGNLAKGGAATSETATDPPVVVNGILALVGFLLLVLALVGLYVRQADAAGTLGLVGFVGALFGTILLAGDFWLEAFFVPYLADQAPAVVDENPTGIAIAGAGVTFATWVIGWVLFAVASWRARVFPRTAAALLLLGACTGFAPGAPGQVLFGVAVGWLGVWLAVHEERGRAARP